MRCPRWVKLRHGLALVVCAAAAAPGFAADTTDAALQRPGAIIVADVTGDVTATFGEQKRPVKADERLRVDSTVTAGRRSAAKLQLSNGATVQLSPESEIEFEDFGQTAYYDNIKFAALKAEPSISRTRIRLARGDVALDVKPLKIERGSSFTLALVAGTLRIAEGSCRAMVQMSDLGLGVCTVELLNGRAEFEPIGGKFERIAPGTKLGFAVEIDKATNAVKLGELPKSDDAKSGAPAGAARKK